MPSGKNAWLTILTFDLLVKKFDFCKFDYQLALLAATMTNILLVKIVILHALLAVSMTSILLVQRAERADSLGMAAGGLG